MIERIYGANVLVEPKNVEEQTGHMLNDGTRVVLPFKIGDNVIVQQYAGTQIADDGHEYLLVNERDVIAKVSE